MPTAHNFFAVAYSATTKTVRCSAYGAKRVIRIDSILSLVPAALSVLFTFFSYLIHRHVYYPFYFWWRRVVASGEDMMQFCMILSLLLLLLLVS